MRQATEVVCPTTATGMKDFISSQPSNGPLHISLQTTAPSLTNSQLWIATIGGFEGREPRLP